MSRIAVLGQVRKEHPTTVRDICSKTNLSTATVYYHLSALRDEGEVTWESGKARTIRPTT